MKARARSNMRQALVVGGLRDFVQRTIGPKLERFGIEVAWHWDMDRLRKGTVLKVPAAAQVVVALVDMMPRGHMHAPQIVVQTKERGIPYVGTVRKSAVFQADFERLGFSLQEPQYEHGEEPAPMAKSESNIVPIIQATPEDDEGAVEPMTRAEVVAAITELLARLENDPETAAYVKLLEAERDELRERAERAEAKLAKLADFRSLLKEIAE